MLSGLLLCLPSSLRDRARYCVCQPEVKTLGQFCETQRLDTSEGYSAGMAADDCVEASVSCIGRNPGTFAEAG